MSIITKLESLNRWTKPKRLTRPRELLIKQNERKAKTYRIEKRVDALVQDAEHAEPDQGAEIFLEMEKFVCEGCQLLHLISVSPLITLR